MILNDAEEKKSHQRISAPRCRKTVSILPEHAPPSPTWTLLTPVELMFTQNYTSQEYVKTYSACLESDISEVRFLKRGSGFGPEGQRRDRTVV